MRLILLGLNHQTAPVAVRERYAVAPAELAGLNEKLVRQSELAEASIISTCNRTEIVVVSSEPSLASERIHLFLQEEVGDASAEARHLYERRDADAVVHLFRVASSLDSMVLGEPQILGQIKQAYQAGLVGRSVGPVLHRLYQRAFRAAKRVRAETGLGSGRLSVARIGVQLAQELFESLAGKSVLLLGAGDMAESALRGLQEQGARDIVVLSRSKESADRLAARVGGRPGSLGAIGEELGKADVVITSLQTDRPLVQAEALDETMHERQGRPLLMVDLGVPRNVDPGCNQIESVYLYDLDDLERVAGYGRIARQDSIEPALQILDQERMLFERWHASLPLVPTIRRLREEAGKLARAELRKSWPEDMSEGSEALERTADAIVAKLLHGPLQRLRDESEEGGGHYYAEAVQRLFGLDIEEDDS